jgi:prevent-host-death family protein
MKTIPQRELRNNVAKVLRDVENGERVRVTVNGRPVADLVPIDSSRRIFVPRDDIVELLRRLRPDPDFVGDVESMTGATIDEL